MDELRWYLYDLVREIMEKHGIEETAYSLETVREGAVCLIPLRPRIFGKRRRRRRVGTGRFLPRVPGAFPADFQGC